MLWGMRWNHKVTVTSGGGASADPIATPANVLAAHCFRLPDRDPLSASLNTCVIFGLLSAAVAEAVDFELYSLDDDDDTGSDAPPAAGRWSLVCTVHGLQGGRTAVFEPYAGGGSGRAPGRGAFCYLRVINETTANNREIGVKVTPGGTGGVGGASSIEPSALDGAAQVWPSVGGAAADPTAAYVASTRTFWVGKRAILHGNAIVSVVAADAIQILVERSLNFGGAWAEYATVTIPAAAIATHRFDLPLAEYALYRISARRIAGTAATRLIVTADVTEQASYRGRDGLAIELQNAKEVGVLCWHNAGAAEALGVAFGPSTSGGWIPIGRANRGRLVVTLTGGVATTHEAQLHRSPDATPTDLLVDVTNTVAGGIRDVQTRQDRHSTGANGTYVYTFDLDPGERVRAYLKYSGGAAPNAIGRLYLWRR